MLYNFKLLFKKYFDDYVLTIVFPLSHRPSYYSFTDTYAKTNITIITLYYTAKLHIFLKYKTKFT